MNTLLVSNCRSPSGPLLSEPNGTCPESWKLVVRSSPLASKMRTTGLSGDRMLLVLSCTVSASPACRWTFIRSTCVEVPTPAALPMTP
ncbi:MAG: hypothetical protein B7Z73_05115 [Planctomycetia bacterium 21-64-5]|nr:MAG: hypothetical protein B7Z73_05115 [Planctomycetia bacterium 21-64-5]